MCLHPGLDGRTLICVAVSCHYWILQKLLQHGRLTLATGPACSCCNTASCHDHLSSVFMSAANSGCHSSFCSIAAVHADIDNSVLENSKHSCVAAAKAHRKADVLVIDPRSGHGRACAAQPRCYQLNPHGRQTEPASRSRLCLTLIDISLCNEFAQATLCTPAKVTLTSDTTNNH